MNITLPENDGFTVEFDTVSGRFGSDFTFSENDDKKIYKNGEKQYEIDTVSGDFKLMRQSTQTTK